MKKSFTRHLKNKYVIGGIVVIVIIILVIWYRSGNKAPNFETAKAAIGNVVETVSVTGTVSPMSDANLAFEKGGVVSKIYVAVGDQVKAGDAIAALDSANDQASLSSAQATLADMSRSLTPQELAVQQASVASAETTFGNAQNDALNTLRTALTQAQTGVFNYADTFFGNPQGPNPQISVATQSTTKQNAINQERYAITNVFTQWTSDISMSSTSSVTGALARSQTYLSTVKSYMTDLSAIINNLSVGNSGLSQSAISMYISAMNSGLSNLNQAIGTITAAQTELTNAQSALDQARSDYNLKLAGNSSQSIAAQAAKVAQAQAILAQDIVHSPIDGIVTQVTPNVGEFVGAGQTEFAVQNNDFKVEAYVPEADIAKIAVGDLASSTLDAFGSYVNFPERVIMIDPAETVLEGVPTYKVTLVFVTPDPRIRSGMTSNLEILTHEIDDILEIPYRAVTTTATSSTVRLVNPDGKAYTEVPVVTGLKGSDGTIQIISGINEGDKVVTYVGQ